MPNTRLIAVDPDHPSPSVIAEAAKILRQGGLVAFATETVYGLGADATNPEAVARIFEAKGRPSTNPLIVHVQDKTAAIECVSDWPRQAEILAETFWPGPLTIVLPRSSIIPDIVTAGEDTVGVRVPRTGVARWLILETGRPIAAPSANRSTGISPTLATHVLKDLDGKIDLILDSGPTTIGLESTVLDLTGERAVVLRPGEITAEQLASVIGDSVEFLSNSTGPARSPGQMAVHYSPRTPMYRMDRDNLPSEPVEGVYDVLVFGESSGVLPFLDGQAKGRRIYIPKPEDAAARLYATLHEVDIRKPEFLLIIPPPDEPQWHAIRDRIGRASQPWQDKPGR